jgi:hypothetical protein
MDISLGYVSSRAVCLSVETVGYFVHISLFLWQTSFFCCFFCMVCGVCISVTVTWVIIFIF